MFFKDLGVHHHSINEEEKSGAADKTESKMIESKGQPVTDHDQNS